LLFRCIDGVRSPSVISLTSPPQTDVVDIIDEKFHPACSRVSSTIEVVKLGSSEILFGNAFLQVKCHNMCTLQVEIQLLSDDRDDGASKPSSFHVLNIVFMCNSLFNYTTAYSMPDESIPLSSSVVELNTCGNSSHDSLVFGSGTLV